ncbi:MAG: type II secretion system protein GspH [Rhodospirillales bacterium 20-64-7]|nr:MAG: type II secretion system protein GspH [Rhodospirillales bacterium 20-64-7]
MTPHNKAPCGSKPHRKSPCGLKPHKRSPCGVTPRNRTEHGFTLLEMLVTLAIMGLMMLLIAYAGRPNSHRLEAERAAARVAAVMRQDRGLAIATGNPVRFALPPLPGWLRATAQLPQDGLVFEQDGSSTGGAVLLLAPGLHSLIRADWLTGRVSIEDSPQDARHAP